MGWTGNLGYISDLRYRSYKLRLVGWVPQLECWEEGYQLFRRHRHDKRGGGVPLYISERVNHIAITIRDDVIESLWVSIDGEDNQVDVTGVSYQLLIKYDNADELVSRDLGEILGSVTLILRENSSFPGLNWKYHLVATKQLLKCVEDNFLSQVLSSSEKESFLLCF